MHTENNLYPQNLADYQEYASLVKAVVIYRPVNIDRLHSRVGFYSDNEVKKLQDNLKKFRNEIKRPCL
jgi:hypothetical protein